MHLLYRIAYSFCLLVLAPKGFLALLKRKEYRRHLGQRFGFCSSAVTNRLAAQSTERCWIHAVSAGEMRAGLVFLQALRRRMPELQAVITTTTAAGQTIGRQGYADRVELLYFPSDFAFCQRRAYRLFKPDFIALVEQDLWPNHLRIARKLDIPVFLINARMPEPEARNYGRIR